MVKLSDSSQRNSFSEGLAIGLIYLDRLPLNYGGKMQFEFALDHAFRNWSHAETFPRINYQLFGRGSVDGLHVATHADTKRLGYTFWWDKGYPLDVYAADHWDDDRSDLTEAAARLIGDVPLEGWVELAQLFCGHLDKKDGDYQGR